MMRALARFCALALAAALVLALLLPVSLAAPEPLALSEQEQAYLDTCGTLRVGYVVDRIPVSFMDKNGELAGISRSVFDRVAAISGLQFEYVPLPSGSITYDYLLDADLDLITSVEYNPENLGARGILITQPYLSMRKVVVARDRLAFDPDASLKVAISTGSQTLRKAMTRMYPNFVLEDYDTITACFDAVRSGEADLLIQNQYVVEYWISKPIYEKLRVIPVQGLEDQLCFSAVVAFGGGEGPSEEDGNLLVSILNKAIERLTEDEVSSYTIQAVMDNQYVYSFWDFLYRYRFAAGIFVSSLLVVSCLSVVLVRLRLRSMESRADAKAKGEFLSTMSHEIRTPLNGLIGLNYLMSQRLDSPERLGEYLRQSTTTAKYLLSLVNDVLDMSMLEEHRIVLSREPVDLELLFSTVASIVRGGMEEKGLHFNSDVQLDTPCVLGDEVRIQQVLLNLLDNARKFTDEGGKVDLIVRQKAGENGDVVIEAEVADTGRGMSEEFQRNVFRSFSQERLTVSTGTQGTGLGLSISRRLARLMGGDVSFTSRKGVGSRFFFTFSAAPASLPADAPKADAAKAGGKERVLVAEDNELNGEIMLEMLGSAGYDAVLAHDGLEALRIFESSPPGSFGVALMDLLMPEMDGCQAAAAIRSLDRPDAEKVRIIACSANTQPGDRERALASGMDGFLPKPVDLERMLEVLSETRPS